VIRTVTLSTGFDEIFAVSALEFGAVSRVVSHQSVASGKGINAARVARALGAPVTAYGFVGGHEIASFAAQLGQSGIVSSLVPLTEPTRRNLTVSIEGMHQPAAHCRAEGFIVADPAPLDELISQLTAHVAAGDLVSLHGATPPGLPDGTWRRLGTLVTDAGARLVADVYGPALIDVLEHCAVLACKPNEEELRVLPGAQHATVREAGRAALRYMAQRQVSLPLVSLGADGVLFLDGGDVWSARIRVDHPVMLVGAGDALVAGILTSVDSGVSAASDLVVRALGIAAAHVEGADLGSLSQRGADASRRVEIERVSS
jgi:1-phosphofructokinase family hexose kinase